MLELEPCLVPDTTQGDPTADISSHTIPMTTLAINYTTKANSGGERDRVTEMEMLMGLRCAA